MTHKQHIAEQRSIEAFVGKEMAARRPLGTDAATSTVIYAAIKAAADMAPRGKTGAISTRIAKKVLRDAVARLALGVP